MVDIGSFKPIEIGDMEAIELCARYWGFRPSFPCTTQIGEKGVPVLVLRPWSGCQVNWTTPDRERASVVVKSFTGVFARAKVQLLADRAVAAA